MRRHGGAGAACARRRHLARDEHLQPRADGPRPVPSARTDQRRRFAARLRGHAHHGGRVSRGLHLLGATPVPLLYASATPGGIVTRAAYDTLRSHLLDGVRDALPVDGVLLALHGAMVAEDAPDAEGDLLGAVRALVGPDVPVIATLDSHANVSPAMVAAATALDRLHDLSPCGYVRARARGGGPALPHPVAPCRPTAALASPPMLVPLPPQSTQWLASRKRRCAHCLPAPRPYKPPTVAC